MAGVKVELQSYSAMPPMGQVHQQSMTCPALMYEETKGRRQLLMNHTSIR